MDKDFLNKIQAYEARAAIPPSTLRGQPVGTIAATRHFLSRLSLAQFGIARRSLFKERLDLATENLRVALPRDAQFWGISRKALNIFLRNAFYNSYLSEGYHLNVAESLLEIPLDSITGKRIYQYATKELPKWHGVMHLRPEQNELYQEVARRVAAQQGIAAVHLDAYWWGGDREA